MLVLRDSSSVCPWQCWEPFQGCHVKLVLFQEYESLGIKPICWLLPWCAVREVLSLSPLQQWEPYSRTPKLAAHLCQELGVQGRQSLVRMLGMRKDTDVLDGPW